MWEWLKKHICFHKWEHIETHSIQTMKSQPPYFISSYRCKKCGKTKSTYIYS